MPECNHSDCNNEATHQGPAESGATPNATIVPWCDEHAKAQDKPL